MLTRLGIRNFKSIGDAGLTILPKPLTILVGPNGAGKSSVLEALGLLAQSVGGPLAPLGPLVNYASKLDPLMHQTQTGRMLQIQVGFTLPEPAGEYLYSYGVIPATEEYEQSLLFIDHHQKKEEPLATAYRQQSGPIQYQYKVLYPNGNRNLYLNNIGNLAIVLDANAFKPTNRLTEEAAPIEHVEREWQKVSRILEQIAHSLKQRVQFLSALRGEVPQAVTVGSNPTWVGKKGEHLVHLLSIIFGSREHAIAREKIVTWANEFGLARLHAGYRGGQELSADFEDSELGTPLGLSLASEGARQVLSIIVQLFSGPPGDIILIEEPEISIHPEAQVKLVHLFADAVAAGKQVMITTHSHYLLLALAEAVADEEISSKNVGIWEIKKENDKGTTARNLPVSRDGIIKGWVSSFARVDSHLVKRRVRQLARSQQ